MLSKTENSDLDIRPKSGPFDVPRLRWWERVPTLLFEFPLYVRLFAKLLMKGMTPYDLARANYGIDHGGFGFVSKFEIQSRLHPSFAIPIFLIPELDSAEERLGLAREEIATRGWSYPLVLKPDNGRIGKGVQRIDSERELEQALIGISGGVVVQPFSRLESEYGVFFVRVEGKSEIFSINGKSFPYVVGDGKHSIETLVRMHQRLRSFRGELSKKVDYSRVPPAGERIPLSYIGNHAQGAVFYDASHLKSHALLSALEESLINIPGFNFGRFDLKATNDAALSRGEFEIIELNGVDSLSTNIFDPGNSAVDAYRILMKQYDTLLAIASEHRDQEMELLPLPQLIRAVLDSEQTLEQAQLAVVSGSHR